MPRHSNAMLSNTPRQADPLAGWLAGVSRVAFVGAALLASPAARAVTVVTDQPGAPVVVATDEFVASSDETNPSDEAADEAQDIADDPAAERVEKVALAGADSSGSRDGVVMATDDAELAGAELMTEEAAPVEPAAKPAELPLEARPARFNGVTPGVTTRDELIEAWGEPAATAEAKGETAGGEVLSYDLQPFEKVEALVEGGVASVIRVTLADEASVSQLIERLRLDGIEPVDVNDAAVDQRLAVAFPEKGLTLLVKPGVEAKTAMAESAITHLVLEPIDARAFVLRCEQRPEQAIRAKEDDLRRAISLDANDAHAHWLYAEQHLAAGEAADAEASAAQAIRLAPTNPAYRVTRAHALSAAGKLDAAVIQTRKVLDDPSAPEIVRAQALTLMGRLAARGDAKITSKAIDFHNAAIEIADRLATTDDARERRLAKDVLIGAHLAVAREVARRDYADKAATVAEWIGRASGLAEERIEADGGGLELRLMVAREALAALSELRPSKDPAPWINEAQETADVLLSQYDDPLFRARVHWELGEAYQHAVRIEHLRGDAQQALAYGTRSIAELSTGAEPRTTSPAAERLVGQLYFYLGAVNAVHKENHAEAVGWYDKGRPILTAEKADSDFVVSRRDGEELVSMGVSYWSQGQKDLAVELTENGARRMERSVAAGVVKEAALGVPYGNLATMYGKLDNSAKATEYRRLLRSVRGSEEPAPSTTEPKAAPVAKELAAKKAAPQQRATPRQTEPPKQQVTKQKTPNGSVRRSQVTKKPGGLLGRWFN